MSSLKRGLKRCIFSALCRLGWAMGEPEESHPKKEEIGRILIILGGGIGDIVRAFPSIQALHRTFPAAPITILLTEPHQEVLDFFSDQEAIHEWIFLDLRGQHRSVLAKLALVLALRRRAFDLVYNPSRGAGMLENAFLTFLIGAPYRIGFNIEGLGYLTTTRLPFRGDHPILHQNLDLLERAGIRAEGTEIVLSLHELHRAFAKELFERYQIQGTHRAIAIHPSARWQDVYRTWPLPKYLALIQVLLEDPGVHVILIGDRKEKAKLAEALGGFNHPRLVNLVGETSLGQAAAVIGSCVLFVGNDSGPLHIAQALKVPIVAIFGSTAPEQVLTPSASCIVVQTKIPSRPCYRHQPFEAMDATHVNSLDLLSVDEVLKAVRGVLQKDARS